MQPDQPTKPGSQFSIEPATWRDLTALRTLEHACFGRDAWPLFDLIGVLAFHGIVRLKAVVDGGMVGFIAGEVRRGERVAWISVVGVLPEYRRQGIGLALMRACESRLTVPTVKLSVRASNQAAIELYLSIGYAKAGTWTEYYQDREDALVMEKSLR
jgi:ribosomal-protein-alanine N-acetyltransferase